MATTETKQRPMLDHALEALSFGYPVFPVCSPLMGNHEHWSTERKRMEACPRERWGKIPLESWRAYQTRLPTPSEVRAHWAKWPLANIGMATGRLAGVVVLDCDSGEARSLAMGNGGLDETPAVWTGKPGGIHYWLKHPGTEVRNFVAGRKQRYPGLDFRGDGGYVLLPPSVHRNQNATYKWNANTVGMKLAEVPPWLMALLTGDGGDDEASDGAHAPLDVDAIFSGISEGARNDTLFRYAGKLRGDNVPQAHAEGMIRMAARLCKPAYDEDVAVGMVRRAYKEYPPNPPSEDWSSLIADDEETVEAKAAEEPVARAFLRPISELLAMPEVEPDWLVNQLFTVGSNGWVAAEPKVGKSWVVLELAYALATGEPFLGRFAIKQPRRVLYIQEEDSLQRVLRRLKKIIKGDPSRGVPSDEYWRWSIRSGFKLDNVVWMEMLRQEIESFSAEVIILDVFNRLHGGKENDQQEMTAILNNLISLTTAYGCSFIVVHHNRKPQQGDDARANQMIRGSGVLAGWAECSLYLKRSKEKDTIIVTPESKDSPELDDFTVVLTDTDNGGLVLQIGDAPEQSTISKGDEAVVEAVRAVTKRGIAATAMEVGKLLGKDRSTVQARLKRLATAGFLTATPISDEPFATIIYAVVSR